MRAEEPPLARTFKIQRSCHGMRSIEAHDLTRAECDLLYRVVTDNLLDSQNHILASSARAFL